MESADSGKNALDVSTSHISNEPGPLVRPPGWKYRQYRIGSLVLPWYASPPVQLLLIAMVCFLTSGMFNALGGMGGGGQVDAVVADDANIALYSVFAVVGFFAGSIVNTIGIKPSLAFGGSGYCIYVASFLCYTYTSNKGFSIFAGALLGACAGLLWTAQSMIMIGYPSEDAKGKSIAWFWMIFNLGAVVGSLIPLGQNIHVTSNSTVTTGTYIGFIVLTGLGALTALTLVNARNIIRKDGSRVIIMKNPTWRSEFIGMYQTLCSDSYIVFLFPMFFASNFFYTYQFNGFNLARFDTRTRALNNLLYWLGQIVGAFIFGYSLDIQSVRRSVRARVVWLVLFAFAMAVWGGAYAFQTHYTRATVDAPGYTKADWTSPGYAGPLVLYVLFGTFDAAWQTSVYWFIGAMSNNARKIAYVAGLYKAFQSAGAVVAWKIDQAQVAYMGELTANWVLLAGSLVVAAPVFYAKIRDHSDLDEDLKLSDETVDEVIGHGGTVASEKSAGVHA